jgi:hypothetical protein
VRSIFSEKTRYGEHVDVFGEGEADQSCTKKDCLVSKPPPDPMDDTSTSTHLRFRVPFKLSTDHLS